MKSRSMLVLMLGMVPSIACDHAPIETPPIVEHAGADRETTTDVATVTPRRTRAGTPRLPGPLPTSLEGLAILERRLDEPGQSEDTRVALADALARVGGPFEVVAIRRFAVEPSARVREALVHALGRSKDGTSIAGLLQALHDPAAGVRTQAARSLGHHAAGAEASASLIAALDDSAEEVQVAAVRALAAHRVDDEACIQGLVRMTASSSPELRLHALRGIARIDPSRAAALPQLERLRLDPDPRVARVANEIRGRTRR